jgi:hypothetical protein
MTSALYHVFRFSESDYRANQEGRITAYQTARLRREFWARMRWAVGVSWGLAGLMLVLGVYGLLAGHLSATWVVLTIGMIFLAAQVALHGYDRWGYLQTDLAEDSPASIEGQAWAYRVPPVALKLPPRRLMLWFLVIDDIWLRSIPAEMDALTLGGFYRVFYTPRSRFILSLAPVQPPQPDEHHDLTEQEA